MGGNKEGAQFPIAGIGASAGGMNSLQCFLSALPGDFGFALVFMQHHSARHKSLLPDLLRKRRPDIEVVELADGMEVAPEKLYLAPPAAEVRIEKGAFRLRPLPGGVHLPIDIFFESLAEDAGERAIGVIFSGAGTDGARGVQAIRLRGGTVFVQDPETAEFPGMPLSVINTGREDRVLPPEGIAKEILRLLDAFPPASDKGVTSAQFDTFCRIILEKTGCRFNHYKKTVVGRRIRRRMYLRGISTVEEYLQMVGEREEEAASVASDLMIGVTSFFRDSLAWKALRTGVIKKLAAKEDEAPVRVWTPACASGEEAYSVAMMLHHEIGLAGRKREIHVFATDVNERALERAREGRYPGSIAADVSPEYMLKYFTSSEDGLSVTISKEIRGCVVFARHDLLADPPFSRLDLIICRNLLIYLEPDTQEKCISLFHYALKDGGFLFLGNAETVGRNRTLFKSLSHRKCRIYGKVDAGPPSKPLLTVPFAAERPAFAAPMKSADGERQKSVIEFIQEALLEVYAPAAVAISRNCDILYFSGPTNRYLRQPRGAPSQNLLDLLPDSVRNRISGAIHRAAHDGGPVSLRATIPGEHDRKRRVTLVTSKLREDLYLVVFREKMGPPAEAGAVSSEASPSDEATVRQLEGELSATRAELQSNIEQLKSLNEELQSSNEELQAANEELETSREELQSLNEELITVNTQLQSKIEEQEETNNDLNNFLASTNIPTIFLDHEFRVKRYTPAMSRLLKLIPSDVGRPIIDMSQENLGPDLIADARAVLADLATARKEILIKGAWYLRSALPYRTSDNRIEGVVITYGDVSDLKLAEERTRRLASFPQLNPNPVCEVDVSGKITFCNPAALKTVEDLGMTKDDVDVFLPKDIDGILGEWDRSGESVFYREVDIKDRVFGETIYLTPLFNVARIYAYDVTERKQSERTLEARLTLAEAANKGALSTSDVLRLTLDELERLTGSRIGFYHFLGPDQETLSLQNWSTNTVSKMCTAEGAGSHYNVSEAGVWVDCVRERRPVIHNDYDSLPQKRGIPPGHAPVLREMVVPIFRGGLIVAIIGVGNKEADYTASDVETARLLGDFSWEIVERKRAEEEIRKHVEKQRAANEELARFNRAAVDRELRMIELKKEVNGLLQRAGQPPSYPLDFEKEG